MYYFAILLYDKLWRMQRPFSSQEGGEIIAVVRKKKSIKEPKQVEWQRFIPLISAIILLIIEVLRKLQPAKTRRAATLRVFNNGRHSFQTLIRLSAYIIPHFFDMSQIFLILLVELVVYQSELCLRERVKIGFDSTHTIDTSYVVHFRSSLYNSHDCFNSLFPSCSLPWLLTAAAQGCLVGLPV